MTFEEYVSNFWKQYLKIEKQFLDSAYYVSLDRANFNTYSQSFVKQILEMGSEIDNVWREMCGLLDEDRSEITAYANYVLSEFPNIKVQSVSVLDTNITLKPFEGWDISSPSKTLKFWDNYNLIKHNRISNYSKASLDTALNILAALYISELYRINQIFKTDSDAYTNIPDEESKLFVMNDWKQRLRTSKIKAHYPVYDDEESKRLL